MVDTVDILRQYSVMCMKLGTAVYSGHLFFLPVVRLDIQL